MRYTVEISRPATRQIGQLPATLQGRIVSAVMRLADDLRPRGAIKMTAADFWRIRIGDYRAIYRIEDTRLVVVVVKVDTAARCTAAEPRLSSAPWSPGSGSPAIPS